MDDFQSSHAFHHPLLGQGRSSSVELIMNLTRFKGFKVIEWMDSKIPHHYSEHNWKYGIPKYPKTKVHHVTFPHDCWADGVPKIHHESYHFPIERPCLGVISAGWGPCSCPAEANWSAGEKRMPVGVRGRQVALENHEESGGKRSVSWASHGGTLKSSKSLSLDRTLKSRVTWGSPFSQFQETCIDT